MEKTFTLVLVARGAVVVRSFSSTRYRVMAREIANCTQMMRQTIVLDVDGDSVIFENVRGRDEPMDDCKEDIDKVCDALSNRKSIRVLSEKEHAALNGVRYR